MTPNQIFKRGGVLLLFLIFTFQKCFSSDLGLFVLPPFDTLNHHKATSTPKPYWPFSLVLPRNSEEADNSSSLNKKNTICDSPAHAYYQSLLFDEPLPDFSGCLELLEYLHQVPIDNISLIYASENLISPSSMMGHTFLKLSGLRDNGEKVEHAVSFYTDINTYNIPKLFLETIFLGKDGVFALSPYSKFINQYVNFEQRNLWEYTIQLNEKQRQLIQLHLWELKNAQLPYFFDRYNCATLITHILRVGRPEIKVPNINKVSPIDVVKALEQADVIESRAVILNAEWRTRMLSQYISPTWLSKIEEGATNIDPASFNSMKERYLLAELGLAYTSFQLQQQIISRKDSEDLTQYYLSLKEKTGGLNIDLSQYKSPSKLANDTQWYLGYIRREQENWIHLGYLPAGLRKEDDSRQYFGNNELRLMEGSVLIDPSGEKIKLNEFSFYSVSSLKPINYLTGGISWKFEIVIEDHYDKNLKSQKSLDIEGGIGATKQVFHDLLSYSLASIGVGFGRGSGYIHGAVEAGMILNMIYDSKVIASYSRLWGQRKSNSYYDRGELTISKFITSNWTVSLNFGHFIGNRESFSEYSLNLKHLY